MAIEFAHVSKVDQGFAWVQKSAVAACSGCAAQSDCGSSAIQQYLSKSYRTVKVQNQCGAVVGDHVEVEIEDALLLRLSVLTYLLPLCVFILGCVLGSVWSVEYTNLLSIGVGSVGLTLGVVFVKAYTQWLFKRKNAPLRAIRVLPSV